MGKIFDKGAKNMQWRKESFFNKWCQGNWKAACKRIKITIYILNPLSSLLKTHTHQYHSLPNLLPNFLKLHHGHYLLFLPSPLFPHESISFKHTSPHLGAGQGKNISKQGPLQWAEEGKSLVVDICSHFNLITLTLLYTSFFSSFKCL